MKKRLLKIALLSLALISCGASSEATPTLPISQGLPSIVPTTISMPTPIPTEEHIASPTPVPSISPSTAPTVTETSPSPVASTPPSGSEYSLTVTAKGLAFDVKTITVQPGQLVVIKFKNEDSVPHNMAFYTDKTAKEKIFVGKIINGPSSTTYRFKAPSKPGNYFFRCDVHPQIMTGTFIVQAKEPGY